MNEQAPDVTPVEPPPEQSATISATLANVMALVLFAVFAAVVMGAYILLWDTLKLEISEWIFAAIVVAAFVVHEAIHGVGYRWAGAPRGTVRFGIMWSKLMPYAHCSAPLRARGYRLAVSLPGIVVGILPASVGLAIGSTWLTAFGAIMTGAAGGDLMVLWAIRHVPGDRLVRDHPREIGCVVLAPSA